LDHFFDWKEGGRGLSDFFNSRKNDSCRKIGTDSSYYFVAFAAINGEVDDDRCMDVL